VFFDNIDHENLVQFIERRVGDPRIIRLIRKWLKAGISEEGEWSETKVGTPQGAVISPLLANIYLHYVLDQWVQEWRKRKATGEAIIVRYAGDFVLGFQYQREAERFRQEVGERLREYGLELHAEKTRLIQFGRFAAGDRKREGKGAPETFDFLGFTHSCGTTFKTGKFTVKRKTVGKRMAAKLKDIRTKLQRRMHEPVAEVGNWLGRVVQGFFNYHAIPGNFPRLRSFRHDVARHWWHVLRRRTQRQKLGAKGYTAMVNRYLPKPVLCHPYPMERFCAKYPR